VNVGALRLSNPILAASGTFGYGVEFAHLLDLNQLGGIVVKGLSLEPMAGAPAPRLCETPSGMLNAVGLQNIGVRAFIVEKLPGLRQFKTAVVATYSVIPSRSI
jgi:dihydroorotate dehydrogenase (NAD+) catalytic subunit